MRWKILIWNLKYYYYTLRKPEWKRFSHLICYRFGVTMFPAVEKTLSLDADGAGTYKIFLLTLAIVGCIVSCSFHHTRASGLWIIWISAIYCSNSLYEMSPCPSSISSSFQYEIWQCAWIYILLDGFGSFAVITTLRWFCIYSGLIQNLDFYLRR